MKWVLMACALVSSCNVFQSTPARPPQIRVDTVTVTQVVEPPLPEGTPTEICLSTGVTAQVHISATGDTLVGEKRIPLSQLRPAFSFAGAYAQDRPWYQRNEVIRFDRRDYYRAGAPVIRSCDELKLVGEHNGVPLFAEVTAPQILPVLIVPIRPGVFQDYPRVRR